VTSVLLGITVHCSLLLYHSLVLLDFMQMKLPLPVVLSVIEVRCLLRCFLLVLVVTLQWLIIIVVVVL